MSARTSYSIFLSALAFLVGLASVARADSPAPVEKKAEYVRVLDRYQEILARQNVKETAESETSRKEESRESSL